MFMGSRVLVAVVLVFVVSGCSGRKVSSVRYNTRTEEIIGFHPEQVAGHQYGCLLTKFVVRERVHNTLLTVSQTVWEVRVWADVTLPDGTVKEKGFDVPWAERMTEQQANRKCVQFLNLAEKLVNSAKRN